MLDNNFIRVGVRLRVATTAGRGDESCEGEWIARRQLTGRVDANRNDRQRLCRARIRAPVLLISATTLFAWIRIPREFRVCTAGAVPHLRARPRRAHCEQYAPEPPIVHVGSGDSGRRRCGRFHRSRHPLASGERPRRSFVPLCRGAGDRRRNRRLYCHHHQIDGSGRHWR